MAHSLLAWRIPALLDRLGAPAWLHASAEFNLGEPSDYRVPDGGLHTTDADGLWLASAALVVEILSPDDETWAKLPFYAAREVAEIVIVDPGDRSVRWLRLEGGRYVATASSALLGIDVDELTALIDWPPTAP